MNRLEEIIGKMDYDGLFEDQDMVNFLVMLKYEYILCTTDRNEAFRAMSHPTRPTRIDDILHANDDAYALYQLANNYENWANLLEDGDASSTAGTNKIKGGRWTNAIGTEGGRKSNSMAWNDEGEKFYKLSMEFFKGIRDDDRYEGVLERALEKWWDDVLEKRMKSGNGGAKRRKTRREEDLGDEADCSYLTEMLGVREFQVVGV